MEKTKKFRENLKINYPEKWRAFQQKERERSANNRKKTMENNIETTKKKHQYSLAEKRTAAEKKRNYRLKIKGKIISTSELPYKCKQTLFKAVNRVKKELPDRSDRKKTIIRELLKQFDPGAALILEKSEKKNVEQKEKDLIKIKTYENVKNFYLRDDISYQTPGISDVIHRRDATTNEKVTLRKRYMVMSISEAYYIFKNEEDGQNLMYKSKFYNLRPQNVFLMADTPNNVCVCMKHSNFNMLCKSLKNVPRFPDSSKALVKEMCCNTDDEDCMNNSCKNCERYLRDTLPVLFEYETQICWNQWVKDKETGRFKIMKYRGTVADAVNMLQEQLPQYKIHAYVNHIQSEYFINSKKLASEEVVIVQIDFAENFAIRNQDEIQAAHFSYEQVTVFTACAWMANTHRSIVIVSNDLNHDKFAVWVYLDVILQFIKAEAPAIKYLKIFSDGCTSQFKNRFILTNLPILKRTHKFNVSRSFFATSHGKGAVDGIGGTVKRCVWNGIRSRRIKIDSATEFAEYATKSASGIKILYVDNAKIDATRNLLSAEWAMAKTIPHLQNQHHFQLSTECHLLASLTKGSKITQAIKLE